MSAPRRLAAVKSHLQASDAVENFEDIPGIRKVAGPSDGPRCKGKVVIITGANSALGIGRASAHQFAANGARAVYICDFADQHLQKHVREIRQLYPGVDVYARQFDAANEEAVKGVIKEAVDKYGRLDVFFANAGIVGGHKPIQQLEVKDLEGVMRTNVTSVMLALKHSIPAMLLTSSSKPHSGGSIIGTASVAGLRANAGGSDYSASKAAVISLMQTTAYELVGTNIRCNAICPGLIETGMTAPVFEMARSRGTSGKIGQLNPMGRPAVADEVARVALFLGSDEASYVNGQAWAVCGGLSASHPWVYPKS